MEAFLLGEMRMTERQAGLATAREIYELMRAWSERERGAWERTRWLAWQMMLLSPNIKPANKPHSVQEFMRLPWETAPAVTVTAEKARVTEREKAVLNAIFDELHARGGQTN